MKQRAKKINRKVPCIGCAKDVNRSDAKFCLLDNGMYCYFCKDCLRKMQKESPQQKKEKTTKEETAITEVSKFEWKEKTCKDIIEDMRNMKKNAYLIFPSVKPKAPDDRSPRAFFCSLPDYVTFFSLVLIPFDYRKTANVAA